jgi:hypothetical protein
MQALRLVTEQSPTNRTAQQRQRAYPGVRRKPAAERFIDSVTEKTVRAFDECLAAASGEMRSDAALGEFMTALERVANDGEVWNPDVLRYLAPVIFALDAQLAADECGVMIGRETLIDAIKEASAMTFSVGN